MSKIGYFRGNLLDSFPCRRRFITVFWIRPCIYIGTTKLLVTEYVVLGVNINSQRDLEVV